jgi:adenosylcobinamide-phosphate synthase
MTVSAAAAVMPAAMLVALAVDRCLGEPPNRWHPVAWMGRYLGWSGARLVPLAPRPACVGGALAWTAGGGLLAAAAWALEAWLRQTLAPAASGSAALVTGVALGLLLKPMLAWRMLREEVGCVEQALLAGLDAARLRLGRLVSRDTTLLDVVQVRETAIETLAENLNDSVVAPLFWFAVAGLPGAVLYRFANTADAMWGYRGRWEWAGKWAARADDVLSWVPARLTALALLPRPAAWPALAREARRTPSPNGGWPMGAMALRLGIALAKPGSYTLHAAGRPASNGDVSRAIRAAGRALMLASICTALLAVALRQAVA